MKGFYIEITNNLLDPKHWKAMKESVWLFMWFLDKMTSIDEDGIGKVLGGKPIKFEEVEKELGISVRTYRRWINKLKEKNYINLKRTPYGCVITVNKARKRFGRSVNSGTSRYARKGTSLVKGGTSNKTKQLDNNNKDKSITIKNNLKNKNENEIKNKIIQKKKSKLVSDLAFPKVKV